VEPGDVDGFAYAVKRLLKSPELATKLGVAGREMVEQNFGCEKMTRRLSAFYLSELDRKGYPSFRKGQYAAYLENE
jgi:glycosyltransferase involved in cell wall biosynthesis